MDIKEAGVNNNAEVTLIGTGGGYGESVVVNLGNNNWVVVDSCLNPKTQLSLPLEYLIDCGVDIENNVKLIVCTHWHDDHINGISNLLEKCKNAKFAFARANDRKKFLQLVSLDYQKIQREASNSSTIEFNKCLEIIKNRNNLVFAQENTILLNTKIAEGINCEVVSLSPSNYTILEFDNEISDLITEYGSSNMKLTSKSPNSKSVVLLLKIGPHRVILGADLEVTGNNQEGWLNILDNSLVIDKKATLFKIPHHGSENGYHQRIWIELLEENTVAALTPFSKNIKLPTIEMLNKYCEHTEKVFMTTAVESKKPKKRDSSIEKMIKNLNYKVYEVKFSKGVIRNTIDFIDSLSTWETEIIENAFHVNSNLE